MQIKNAALKAVMLCLSIAVIISALPLTAFASPNVIFEGNDPEPINKNANQTAKNFYQYLWNCGKSDKIVSGAVSYQVYGADTTLIDAEHDYHKQITDFFGVAPAIFGNMAGGQYKLDNNYLPVLLDRYKKGSVSMHNYEPSLMALLAREGINEKDMVSNLDKTNPDRNMEYYNTYMQELKEEADFFEAMEGAGIEVYILRLFVEINNTSRRGFYGATPEGYAACKRVWQQAIEYFTVERGLTGILFLWSPAGYTTSNQFYPGDDYVDLLAPTSYSGTGTGEIYANENCADYEWLKTIKKPFGLSELGPRSFFSHAVPDALGDCKKILDSMLYAFPETSFAVFWYCDTHSILPPGDTTTCGNYNGAYYMYSPNVIVAEELPNFKTDTPFEKTGNAGFYSDGKCLSNLSIGNYSSKLLKQKGLNISSVDSVSIMHGSAILAYSTEDCSGKATVIYGNKQKLSQEFKKAKSLAIIKLENVAFEKNIWIEGYENSSAAKLNDGLNNYWEIESNKEDCSMEITIDLGREYNVGQMSINHAGFNEDFKYNIRDFEISASEDGLNYHTVYKNIGNVYPASNFWFNPVNARYIRLKIVTPNSSTFEIEKNRISLAEIEVYGLDSEKVIIENQSAGVITEYGNSSTPSNNSMLLNNNVGETAGDGNNGGIAVESVDNNGNESDNAENIAPPLSQIVIPEFFNYVWIIICGGILVLSGSIFLIIFFINKKKMKQSI